MGWNDHLNTVNFEIVCPFCKQKFEYGVIPQKAGCRDLESLYCPFCKKEIETSMEYEYFL